jgi:ribosome-binding protein aMBF1 (putative translation factor)
MEIKQLKLSNGEEVLCKVVSEDEQDIVVKDALMIVCRISDMDNTRYYTFRPFMVYQDEEDDLIVIRTDKLVAYANPTEELVKEYYAAIRTARQMNEVTSKLKLMQKNMYRDSDNNIISLFGPDKNLH